jgi:hypothetical protein
MPALRFQEASMATTRRTRQQTKKVAEPVVEDTNTLTVYYASGCCSTSGLVHGSSNVSLANALDSMESFCTEGVVENILTSTTEYPSQQCVAKPSESDVEEAPVEVKELVIEEPKTPKSKSYQNKAIKKPETKTKTKYVPAEPKGHIIRIGEEITVPGDDMGNSVVVSEDVYREILPRNSKRTSFILLYTKGTVVPKFALKKLQ